MKILVHGISYVVMFIILQNSVMDSNYSMLLVVSLVTRLPGFLMIGEKILVIIQGNGNVMAIAMMKQLDNDTKDHKRWYVNHG